MLLKVNQSGDSTQLTKQVCLALKQKVMRGATIALIGEEREVHENAYLKKKSKIAFFKHAVLENGVFTGGQQIQLFIEPVFYS